MLRQVGDVGWIKVLIGAVDATQETDGGVAGDGCQLEGWRNRGWDEDDLLPIRSCLRSTRSERKLVQLVMENLCLGFGEEKVWFVDVKEVGQFMSFLATNQ